MWLLLHDAAAAAATGVAGESRVRCTPNQFIRSSWVGVVKKKKERVLFFMFSFSTLDVFVGSGRVPRARDSFIYIRYIRP